MTQENLKLSNCPWQIFNKGLHKLARVNDRGESYILCSCGCQGPRAKDEGQAIGFWNTRAEPRPAEEPTIKDSLTVPPDGAQGVVSDDSHISKLIRAAHDAVSYIASLGIGDFDGQRYLSVAAIKARGEHTKMTAEIERLRAEVARERAEATALRLWLMLPSSVCLSCGGDNGHHEGCPGTTGLVVVADKNRELVDKANAQGQEIYQLRERVKALEEGQKWQPIETAPRDGTRIDLWVDGEFEGRVADCYWGKADHCCGEAGDYCDSDWHSTPPGWVTDFGEMFALGNITHWMPIPILQPAKRVKQ